MQDILGFTFHNHKHMILFYSVYLSGCDKCLSDTGKWKVLLAVKSINSIKEKRSDRIK